MYDSVNIRIENTADIDVAMALAYLASFGRGVSFMQRTAAGLQARREVIIFHRDTIAKDPDLFPFGSLDIMVAKLPNDIYRIRFDTEKVDSSLIGGVEEEIRKAYSERDAA